jgi:hypothetical protein
VLSMYHAVARLPWHGVAPSIQASTKVRVLTVFQVNNRFMLWLLSKLDVGSSAGGLTMLVLLGSVSGQVAVVIGASSSSVMAATAATSSEARRRRIAAMAKTCIGGVPAGEDWSGMSRR